MCGQYVALPVPHRLISVLDVLADHRCLTSHRGPRRGDEPRRMVGCARVSEPTGCMAFPCPAWLVQPRNVLSDGHGRGRGRDDCVLRMVGDPATGSFVSALKTAPSHASTHPRAQPGVSNTVAVGTRGQTRTASDDPLLGIFPLSRDSHRRRGLRDQASKSSDVFPRFVCSYARKSMAGAAAIRESGRAFPNGQQRNQIRHYSPRPANPRSSNP